MVVPALTDHRAGRQVECHKQSGGAMANVVVSHAFDIAQALGQQRLGAFQDLDLALFINAQRHRFVPRVAGSTVRRGEWSVARF